MAAMRRTHGTWAGAAGIAAVLLAGGTWLGGLGAEGWAAAALCGIVALGLGLATGAGSSRARVGPEPSADPSQTEVSATVVGHAIRRFEADPAPGEPRPPDPTSDPTEPYDLYVSYARADNQSPYGRDHWVQALLRRLNQARRRVGIVSDYNVFFDASDVRSPADWEGRLSGGLHASSVLLALLSPRWLASEVCHAEWRSFVDRREGQGDPAIVPVLSEDFPITPRSSPAEISAWFDTLPDDVPRPDADERSVATDVHERVESVLGPPVCDLSLVGDLSWAELMADQGLEAALEELAGVIDGALERARARSAAPHDPFFVGRQAELACLRSAFPSRLAVVRGAGGRSGLGRSSLVAHHALQRAHDYRGGVYWLDGARCTTLEAVLEPLAQELEAVSQGSGVLDALRRRCGSRGACLLVLYSVEEPAILGDDVLAPLLDASWVHVAVVAGEVQGAGERRTVVEVPPLPAADAVEVVRRRLPGRVFPTDAERAAAAAIAERLDGWSAAVQAASLEIGLEPPHRCSALQQWLEQAPDGGRELIARHRSRLPSTPASEHTMNVMEPADDP